MNKFLDFWIDFAKHRFPHIPFVIFSLSVAAIWKGSGAAAVAVTVLVICAYNSAAIAQILEPFKRPANPADEQKLRALVEALNKAHANDKKFDEELQALRGEIGKVNLRFAIKPANGEFDS